VLPSSTILFQTDGPQVGIVNSQSQIELRKVTLGHDFGDTIEIMAGVRSGDAVVANPPDSLTNGMRVVVETASPAPKYDTTRELNMYRLPHCGRLQLLRWRSCL